MGWPCRLDLWGETLVQARADYATVANTIAEFEPVTMIANPARDASRQGPRAARAWTWSRSRSTTRGCVTPARST